MESIHKLFKHFIPFFILSLLKSSAFFTLTAHLNLGHPYSRCSGAPRGYHTDSTSIGFPQILQGTGAKVNRKPLPPSPPPASKQTECFHLCVPAHAPGPARHVCPHSPCVSNGAGGRTHRNRGTEEHQERFNAF